MWIGVLVASLAMRYLGMRLYVNQAQIPFSFELAYPWTEFFSL